MLNLISGGKLSMTCSQNISYFILGNNTVTPLLTAVALSLPCFVLAFLRSDSGSRLPPSLRSQPSEIHPCSLRPLSPPVYYR